MSEIEELRIKLAEAQELIDAVTSDAPDASMNAAQKRFRIRVIDVMDKQFGLRGRIALADEEELTDSFHASIDEGHDEEDEKMSLGGIRPIEGVNKSDKLQRVINSIPQPLWDEWNDRDSTREFLPFTDGIMDRLAGERLDDEDWYALGVTHGRSGKPIMYAVDPGKEYGPDMIFFWVGDESEAEERAKKGIEAIIRKRTNDPRRPV